MANPRNQQGHNQNLGPQLLPQVHQPLIPSSLPPELRQEYQQQLLQLQKTQESIQRLLQIQQQLKAQQQLLQVTKVNNFRDNATRRSVTIGSTTLNFLANRMDPMKKLLKTINISKLCLFTESSIRA